MSPRVRSLTSHRLTEDQLRGAYERSNWALNDRAPSVAAVARAAARLQRAAASMVDRRRKRGDRGVYRVLLDRDHLFEYLLLNEIEREEVRQERAGYRLTDGDLTKRFVKHPIKLAMNHNGFYAAAGMCFGLCAYTATEALRQFHAVAPSAVAKGDRECSRAKRLLVESLVARFARVAAVERGPSPNQTRVQLKRAAPTPQCLALMKEGLALYTPSGVRHVIPPGYVSGQPLPFSEEDDQAELERIHAFFDLQCHNGLTSGLDLDSFDVRARTLVLRRDPPAPDFGPESDGTHGFPLTQIRALIDEEVHRSLGASPHMLRIRVDGIHRAFLDRPGQSVPMVLEENASVVEIVGDSADGVEAVLATYVLTYGGEKTERWDVPLPWSDGERITCTFDYGEDDCVNALFDRRGVCSVWTRPDPVMDDTHASHDSTCLVEPGTEFAGHRIVTVIGVGGLGSSATYMALNQLQRVVVLKLFTVSHADADHLDLGARLRECRRATWLRHPNIGATYYVGAHHPGPVIVREFVDGMTIQERLGLGPIPPREALSYLDQVLVALDCAHRQGIVHRDLKPSNILVQRDKTIKVLDFGTAALSVRSPLSANKLTLGVPYIAPEQKTGGSPDARADLFTLGVVAYEMLTGQHPFAGRSADDEDPIDVAPVPPRRINPTLPRDLSDVIVRAVEREPVARFQSADAFRRALLGCRASTARSTAARNRSDRALVAAFGNGDTGAAEALYRLYYDYVRGHAVRLGVDRSECADLVNMVFIGLMFERRPPDSHTDLPGRLWSIARRAACQTSPRRLRAQIDRIVGAQSDAVQDYLTCARRRGLANAHALDDASLQSTGARRLVKWLIAAAISTEAALALAARASGGLGGAVLLFAGLALLLDWRLERRQKQSIRHYRSLEDALTALREACEPRTAEDGRVGVVHLPQDWRQVVPLARGLALRCHGSSRAGADETLGRVLEAADHVLPPSRLRPSLRATLDSLLKDQSHAR